MTLPIAFTSPYASPITVIAYSHWRPQQIAQDVSKGDILVRAAHQGARTLREGEGAGSENLILRNRVLRGEILEKLKQACSMFKALSIQTSFLGSLRAKVQNITRQPLPLFRKSKHSSLLGTSPDPLKRTSADYSSFRNHPKWGFIIYRCDYRDESTWEHFIGRWSQVVNTWLIRKHQGELIKNLKWTVREDRAALDRATVEDVRKLFTAWTKTKEAVAEQQAALDLHIPGSPRYLFCIHVDAKALDGCLIFDSLTEDKQLRFWNQRRDPALGHAPYVNIVAKDVEIAGTSHYDEEEEEEEDGEEEEIISIKVHWHSAIPDVYLTLNQTPDAFRAIAYDVDQDGVHL